MYGLYHINVDDDVWTLVETHTLYQKAVESMKIFRLFVIATTGQPPYCTAISKGHIEQHVDRNELKAIQTGRHF
jgi:hypothetical protein